MSDEDEIRALTEELDMLTREAEAGDGETERTANKARQTEIRTRLAALGRPVG